MCSGGGGVKLGKYEPERSITWKIFLLIIRLFWFKILFCSYRPEQCDYSVTSQADGIFLDRRNAVYLSLQRLPRSWHVTCSVSFGQLDERMSKYSMIARFLYKCVGPP